MSSLSTPVLFSTWTPNWTLSGDLLPRCCNAEKELRNVVFGFGFDGKLTGKQTPPSAQSSTEVLKFHWRGVCDASLLPPAGYPRAHYHVFCLRMRVVFLQRTKNSSVNADQQRQWWWWWWRWWRRWRCRRRWWLQRMLQRQGDNDTLQSVDSPNKQPSFDGGGCRNRPTIAMAGDGENQSPMGNPLNYSVVQI